MWCLVLVLAMMAKSSAGSTRAPASARRSTPSARPSKAPARKGGAPGGGPPEQASAVASFYRAHRREIWGLVSLVVALICALGIYGGLGGLVGSAFRRAAGISVGWARLAVPLALAAAGVLLVAGRHAAAEQEERHPSVRIIGGCLVMAALAGILHLAAGRPTWGDGLADFEDAGGYLGFASGGALALLAGVAGAVVVLLAVGLLGWLAVSGMSLSTVARGLWLVLRRVGLALAAVARLVVAGRQALSTEEQAPEQAGEEAGDPEAPAAPATGPAAPGPPPLAMPAAAPLSGGPRHPTTVERPRDGETPDGFFPLK